MKRYYQAHNILKKKKVSLHTRSGLTKLRKLNKKGQDMRSKRLEIQHKRQKMTGTKNFRKRAMW